MGKKLDTNNETKEETSRKRLDRLIQTSNDRSHLNHNYSRFIRWMRLILPTIALIIVAVVMSWGYIQEEQLAPLIESSQIQQSIGKNELLNPRFESRDDKNQPYTITAGRALQGEDNENLIILDEPLADMMLNSGNWVAIQSIQGAYRQDNERLLLREKVKLFHDEGYQLETEELHLDLNKSTAWSDLNVYAQGPAGTIYAKGLQANLDQGLLLFTGPAKLILNQSVLRSKSDGETE